MLKGKLAVVAVQGHSSLLTAVLAQDSPSDESVVCSAAPPDQGWGQGRAAAEQEKFTAQFSLDKLHRGQGEEVLSWMPAKGRDYPSKRPRHSSPVVPPRRHQKAWGSPGQGLDRGPPPTSCPTQT